MDQAISPPALRQLLHDPTCPRLIVDVRGGPASVAADSWIEGALRRDPDAVQDWAAYLQADCVIVVYRVHGHGVSRGVAKVLRERGLEPPTSSTASKAGMLLGHAVTSTTRSTAGASKVAAPCKAGVCAFRRPRSRACNEHTATFRCS